MSKTEIFIDAAQLATWTAEWIAGLIAAKRGRFRIALTGGSTPRGLYSELASRFHDAVNWSQVDFFWGDERFVPHDHPDSNYRMASETLLSHIAVPDENIHPIPGEGDPDAAARQYEAVLKRAYGSEFLDPARPLFDLVLLGLGGDGHICSLFPGSPALDEKQRWVVPVTKGRPETRITLSYPAIESSRMTAFVVTGAEKTQAVDGVRSGDQSLPGARLRPTGELIWLLDRAAAGLA